VIQGSDDEIRHVVHVEQLEDIGSDPDEQRAAVRALMGTCLFGILDHYGARDQERDKTSGREDVRLSHLVKVVKRGDTGLHGCGFEYAVHETLNNAAGIPLPLRLAVSSAVSAEVGALYQLLGVPFTSWPTSVRSVMFGVERNAHSLGRTQVESQLGPGALIWPGPGQDPLGLTELVPYAAVPSFSQLRWHNSVSGLSPSVSDLWKTDLFLGGAHVERTEVVRRVAGDAIATAWVTASLKYRRGKVVGGRGLHLGLETSFNGRPNHHSTEVSRRMFGDLQVLTLPVDGSFVSAFNRAWRTVNAALRYGLARSANPSRHPRWASPLVEELGRRRSEPVVDVANDLISGSGRTTLVARREVAASLDTSPLLAPIPQAA